MASDLYARRTRKSTTDVGRLHARAQSRLAAIRRNIAVSWRFATRRRRDRRFRIQPYDAFQVLNASALAFTAFLLLAVLLDPHLPAWRTTLPQPVVGFFRFLTEFGKADWILIGTGVALIVALLIDVDRLRPRHRANRAVHVFAAGYVFLAVAISGITVNLLKYIIGRARPKLFDDSGSFSFDFWSWDADWASFPSGHATTGMAFGVALALLFPRLRWLFICLGFWIAASRPVVGAHYPSDVLAGILLGGLTAWLIARAFAQHRIIFGFDAGGYLVRRKGASGRF